VLNIFNQQKQTFQLHNNSAIKWPAAAAAKAIMQWRRCTHSQNIPQAT